MMRAMLSRRNLIKAMGAAAVAPVLPRMAAPAQDARKPWWLGNGMPQESVATPKIACAIDVGKGLTDEAIRKVVQIGVYHVLSGGPEIPWTTNQLRPIVDKLKAGGVKLGNLMIGGFPNVNLRAAGARRGDRQESGSPFEPPGKSVCPWWNTTSTRTARWKATSKRRGGAAQA